MASAAPLRIGVGVGARIRDGVDVDSATVKGTLARIKAMIEGAVDCMKTSAADALVYLVGGGTVLVPDDLADVSSVHRFPHSGAANAVSAACALISAVLERNEATRALLDFAGLERVGGLVALEIGGGNGMHLMAAGCSSFLDVPVIDGGFVGRAYPTGWQTMVNVFDKSDREEMTLPNAMCSGKGNN
ncbi:hypothetical protein CspeluHIS016_0100470 [Cutaneotrichosporon spelunceum]|uniref:S-Me-THD N-terminal domain-containing protein n=1 Tax=Cutaneotrichosporon spelunceum TaxID=1672016 RepID=A0AAD3TNB2_9TREE|nr:hypothetical protein CspeluHIS016_0100470 [Cutaneotrichosporon spelunceum]